MSWSAPSCCWSSAWRVSFVYWYTDQKDKRTYQRYEIYYDGTVSGLTAGSPVRYLGVDVGKVARIMLDPKNRKRVEVVADIEESAPIDARTLALLSLQGVTGLLFIDLEEDPKATSNGPLPMGEHYPVIRSAPSDLDVFLRSLPALANHATDLVDHMDQVFSEENVKHFKATAGKRACGQRQARRSCCTRSRIWSPISAAHLGRGGQRRRRFRSRYERCRHPDEPRQHPAHHRQPREHHGSPE